MKVDPDTGTTPDADAKLYSQFRWHCIETMRLAKGLSKARYSEVVRIIKGITMLTNETHYAGPQTRRQVWLLMKEVQGELEA